MANKETSATQYLTNQLISTAGFSTTDGTWSPENPSVFLLSASSTVGTVQYQKFIHNMNQSLKLLQNTGQFNAEQMNQIRGASESFSNVVLHQANQQHYTAQANHHTQQAQHYQHSANTATQQANHYNQLANQAHAKASQASTPEARAHYQGQAQHHANQATKLNNQAQQHHEQAKTAQNAAAKAQAMSESAASKAQVAQSHLDNVAKNVTKYAKDIADVGNFANVMGLALAGDYHKGKGLDATAEPYAKAAVTTSASWAGGVFGMAAGSSLALAGAGAVAAPIVGGIAVGLLAGALAGLAWDAAKDKYWKDIADSLTLRDVSEYWGEKLYDWREKINKAKDWFDKPNRQGKHYYYDPIVLDLDGDGIETLAHNKNKGAMFDFDADGLKHATGWVKSDDGILVFDRNADGFVNDGREVFGDSTLKADGSLAKHGFDALADLDTNADGYINQDDDAYKLLKVWQDKNQDGLSQADELKTLEELGIQSLNLSYQDTKQNLNGGNELAQIGSYTKTDGTSLKMGDVNFKFDSLYSQHSLAVDITDVEIAFLPNLAGGGRVRSLHEAMQLSAELKDIVIQYAQATTKQAQLELLPSLLKAWAKTDPDYQEFKVRELLESVQSFDGTGVAIAGSPRHETITVENTQKIREQYKAIAHKIGVIDSFLGTKTENLYYHSEQNAKETIDLINKTYDDLSTAIYSGLYGQGGVFNHYNQYVQLHISFDDEQNIQYQLNFAPLIEHFQQKIATGDEQQLKTAFVDLVEYINYFQKQKTLQQYDIKDVIMLLVEFSENINIEQQTEWLNAVNPHILKQGFIKFGADTNDNITASIVIAKDGNDRVYGTEQKDFLLAGHGNDHVEARQGDDYIDGGDGNDTLYGQDGSDTLIGGIGNDHLDGGYSADTYIFSKGHGQDTIHDYDWTTPNGQRPQDKVIFTDVRSDEIQIVLNGEHLIIKGYHEQDQITLLNFTRGEHYHIEQFEFADKTVSLTELLSEHKISGTAHNDNLSFSYWTTNVTLDGADGNDNLYGGQANDTLIGGLGNDHVEAKQGDDYIDGGDGNDTLYGQDGSDTLIGGTGNDHLDGGYSADTYIFSKGHGQDTIHDYDWTAPNGQRPQDKIIFTDVRSDEIQIELNGGNLILKGYHEQDQITLRNFTHGSDYHIEQFEFVDKTVSFSELMNLVTATHQSTEQGTTQHTHQWLGKVEANLADGNDEFNSGERGLGVIVDGGTGNDRIYTRNANDTIYGGADNDYVEAKQGDDYIDGGDGNDTLYGQDGSDTLIGGTGNDHLDGGYSADSYIFSKGHGQDTIHDYDWTAPNGQRPQDKIIFTDVRSDEIQIELNGGNLILKGYHEQDQITLRNFTHGSDYHIEQFEFVDKTVSFSELMNLVTATHQGTEQGTTQHTHQWLGKVEANLADGNDEFNSGERGLGVIVDGGTGNDRIYTRNANDTIYGGADNDYVEAKQGDDYIDGGDGNDTLYGQDGSDTLIGGTGNDHLDGGYSADSYIFSKGHGQDTIHDYDWTAPNGQRPQDKIIFTDVRSDEIQIELNGGNLILKGYHEQDQITLRNFTHGSDYHIEQFEFVDKTVSFSELMNLVTATHQSTEQGTTQHTHQWLGKVEANLADGNDEFNSGERGLGVIVDGGTGNDRIYTRNANDTIYGGADNDYVEAKQGDDYIDGGDGNDTLYGQDGSDTLIGGTGNDHLDGGYSADSYIFSKGHGQDTIHDYDWTAPNGQRPQDKIIFTDVRSDEIQIELNGGNLILKGYHEQDQITLRNFTHGSDYHIEQFEFVDKTVSFSELMNLVTATHQSTEQGTTQHTHQWLGKVEANLADGNDEFNSGERGLGVIVDGGTGNDRIYTRNANDTIYGGADNDYVEAKQGDDYIDGGDGNDTLYGQDGSDTLIGGTGNDHLDGGYSADSYIFSKGHGQDTIHDYDWTAPNGQRPQDKIIFTDVRSDEIQIELNSGNLILKGYHEQDQITLRNFTHGSDYHIEQFEFVDKTVSLTELLSEHKISGTSNNDHLSFSNWNINVSLDGSDGNDSLYGGQLNDTLIGGLGNDYLYGGNGADTAVLQMLDLTHHHIDYFADFNLKQGDKLDIRDLLEQPNQTIDLSNLSDYFSTEKTNDGMVLKFDQDGQYQDQHQSQAIMRFQSNAFDSLDQLIQANSFIL